MVVEITDHCEIDRQLEEMLKSWIIDLSSQERVEVISLKYCPSHLFHATGKVILPIKHQGKIVKVKGRL